MANATVKTFPSFNHAWLAQHFGKIKVGEQIRVQDKPYQLNAVQGTKHRTFFSFVEVKQN
jgi:hypothetical protein